MKRRRVSQNIRDERTPFPPIDRFKEKWNPFTGGNMFPKGFDFDQLARDIYKEDRATPAMAAHRKRNPFTKAMDTAAKSDLIAARYKDNSRPPPEWTELTMDDFKNTQKYDRVAGASKRARPTASDAFEAKKATGVSQKPRLTAAEQRRREAMDRNYRINQMRASRARLAKARPGQPMTKDGKPLD